jgi:hypothetical protein
MWRHLLGAAALLAVTLGWASGAGATWGMLAMRPPKPTPPDQSWLTDTPEGARSRGKVAVFAFRGDDVYEPVRAAVVRLLRRRGLAVTVSLKPVQSAVELREMSQAGNLAAYVSGELVGEGARQRAAVHLYSGLTGHRVATARFAGPTDEIVDEIQRKLWTRVGPPLLRACTGAARPRRHEREPMRIDASDDIVD